MLGRVPWFMATGARPVRDRFRPFAVRDLRAAGSDRMPVLTCIGRL
jgi:hypothetical protein